jgi:organic radical activating enzyme
MTAGLLVNEVFGPVWQGEGRQTGQLAAFVRLGGCNLACGFCDTPHAVFFDTRKAKLHIEQTAYDPKVELSRMSVEEVQEKLRGFLPRGGLVVVSGGEPLMQQATLGPLVANLLRDGFEVAFETAGTLRPGLCNAPSVQWTVSPKLSNSGNPIDRRFKPEVLDEFNMLGADFKFVVTSDEDVAEIEHIVDLIQIPPNRTWLMPEGIDMVTVLDRGQIVAKHALAHGWNFTLRQHILLYGNERAR